MPLFDGVRSRISAPTRNMAIQNGTTAATSSSEATPKSVLFKSRHWSRLNVRTRFRILDFVVNCALLTPLAVLFQVGASGIQDALFLNRVPGWVGTTLLLAIGTGVEFVCSFWQQSLSGLKIVRENDPQALGYIIATRLYHFAVGFANVCHYRGLSDVYYYLLGTSAGSALRAVTTSIIVLSGMRCVRNVIGSPLAVGVDTTIEEFFETSTLFRTKSDRYVRHLADNTATVFGVTSCCFLHWIAVWALCDALIYPDNPAVSVLVSWALGHTLAALLLLAESGLKRVSRSLEKRNRVAKIAFENAVFVAANLAVVLVWRGHWVFFESLAFYFPIRHGGVDVTAFYGNFASFVMMCFLHTSAMLIMKGCDFDGDLEDGDGVAFGIDYFAEFFSDDIKQQVALEEKQSTVDKNKNTQQAQSDSKENKKEL